MREIINNTPQDSGLGDSLFVAFNKVNAMTLELYNQDASFSGELQTISAIVDTINDGSVLNHQHTISQIIGLQTALNGKVSTSTFNNEIASINATIQQINSTISDIIDELQTKVDEAPEDGNTYGRKDGGWVIVTGSTSSGDTSNLVPYTGATKSLDLGAGNDLFARSLYVYENEFTGETSTGQITWNTIDGTFDMTLLNNTKLQAGQELHFYGKAEDDILNGESVQFVGTQGDHFIFKRAVASEVSANPELFIGVATQNINANEFGYVTSFGKVRDLDTTMWEEGDILYFDSDGISGETLVPQIPPAGDAHIIVAAVIRKHPTQGVIFVRPHVMPKLSQIQDVSISGVTNGQVLIYDEGLWKNGCKTIYQEYISPIVVTTPTVISSLRIPAGWIKDGETIKIEYIIRKDTVTTNNVFYNLFQGTTVNSTTNAIVNNTNLTPNQRTNPIIRYLTLNGTNLICNVRVNNTAGIQTAPDSAPLVITGFNRNVDNWISLQVVPTAPDAPAAYINYMIIEKYTK
jgi:hypothetical protein